MGGREWGWKDIGKLGWLENDNGEENYSDCLILTFLFVIKFLIVFDLVRYSWFL